MGAGRARGGPGALTTLFALASGWASTAGAVPSAAQPAEPVEPGSPATAVDAPIELDGVAFQGETHGERPAGDRGRPRVEALVLLSAADGVGVGGQVRSGVFGVRGTVAYQPLLFLVDADPADKEFGAFAFVNSIQFNVDAMLVGVESERGGSLGYRFNDLLGHGVTLAYQSVFKAWDQRFSLSFPVTYYPAATERVRARLGIERDYAINFPFGAGLQYGVGAAWVF
jgi:hypothetical protein